MQISVVVPRTARMMKIADAASILIKERNTNIRYVEEDNNGNERAMSRVLPAKPVSILGVLGMDGLRLRSTTT